jgi:ClpP class serine protease
MRGVWEHINRSYDVFLDRVMTSRNMPREAFDAIGGSRVRTDRQALENGLVDELDGLDLALHRAREKAGLNRQAKVREVKMGETATPAGTQPAGWVAYTLDGMRVLRPGNGLAPCPLVPTDEGF